MPARTQTHGASTPAAAPARRRSTRISSTGKTSRYFEQDDVDDEDAPAARSAKAKKRAAGPEDSDEVDDAPFREGPEDADEEGATSAADDGLEATPPSRKRSRGRPAKATPNKKAKPTGVVEDNDPKGPTPRKRGRPAKAVSKTAAKKQPKAAEEEEEDDDNDDSEEENRITIEPLPQLRDTGGIAYEDTKLHPNTLAFLKDLKANNKRSWLKGRNQRRGLENPVQPSLLSAPVPSPI